MMLTSRLRVLLNANLNALIGAAENPRRLLKLYAQEILDTREAITRQRHALQTEIRRLTDAGNPALSGELLLLEQRDAELAEDQARLAARLGEIEGRLVISHLPASTLPTRPEPEPAGQDTDRFFQHAVNRFEQQHNRFERWYATAACNH